MTRANLGEAGRRMQVDGFSYFGGRHCETASLQKVLRHHALLVSEELLFGLGGGIGFAYWQSKGMSRPFIGARNGKFPDFTVRMGAALGQRIEVQRTSSQRRAYDNLMHELALGRPVICYGDIFFLPYFQVDRHFGGHAFVVYGVDEPNDRVLVSDRTKSPRTCTLAELVRARGSTTPPFPPRNSQLRIHLDAGAAVTDDALREAIRSCCRSMLHPPMSSFGLPGLRTFADRCDRIVREAPPEQVVDHLMTTYVDLELAGTGGNAFRTMYRAFLAEAERSLGLGVLVDAVELADHAVAAWATLIQALLPEWGPGLRGVAGALRSREQVFETGTVKEAAAAGDLASRLEESRAEAANEVRRHRGRLLGLGRHVEDVHKAEVRLFAALSRV